MGIGFIPHGSLIQFIIESTLLSHSLKLGSASIFISLNHPQDTSRVDEAGQMVMSVVTHSPNPAHFDH